METRFYFVSIFWGSDHTRGVFLFLSPGDRLLESDELRICPSEYMQASGECDTDVPVVPWLCLVFIEFDSFLVALCPSVLVSVVHEPLHIATIGGILCELSLIAHVE